MQSAHKQLRYEDRKNEKLEITKMKMNGISRYDAAKFMQKVCLLLEKENAMIGVVINTRSIEQSS